MDKKLLEKFAYDWNEMQYDRPGDKRYFLPGYIDRRVKEHGELREPDSWYKRLLWGAKRFLKKSAKGYVKSERSAISKDVGAILGAKNMSCTSTELVDELRKLGYSDEEIESIGVKTK